VYIPVINYFVILELNRDYQTNAKNFLYYTLIFLYKLQLAIKLTTFLKFSLVNFEIT